MNASEPANNRLLRSFEALRKRRSGAQALNPSGNKAVAEMNLSALTMTELVIEDLLPGDVLLFFKSPIDNPRYGALDAVISALDGVPYGHAAIVLVGAHESLQENLADEVPHKAPGDVIVAHSVDQIRIEPLRRLRTDAGTAPYGVIRVGGLDSAGRNAVAESILEQVKHYSNRSYPLADLVAAGCLLGVQNAIELEGSEAKPRMHTLERRLVAASEEISKDETLMCAAFVAQCLAVHLGGTPNPRAAHGGQSPKLDLYAQDPQRTVRLAREKIVDLTKNEDLRWWTDFVSERTEDQLLGLLLGAPQELRERLLDVQDESGSNPTDPHRLWTIGRLLRDPAIEVVGFCRDWGADETWVHRCDGTHNTADCIEQMVDFAWEHPDNEQARDLLLDNLAKGTLSALIGSGAAAGGPVRGPSWAELLSALGPVPAGASQQAAATVATHSAGWSFEATLKSTLANFDLTRHLTTDTYVALASLGLQQLVTFNYDLGAEDARRRLGLNDWWRYGTGERTSSELAPVVHLHGVVDKPGGLVLGLDSYSHLYSSAGDARSYFQRLWTETPLLIVGVGFGDAWPEMILSEISSGIPGQARKARHSAFVSGVDPDRSRVLRAVWEAEQFRYPVVVPARHAKPSHAVLTGILRRILNISQAPLSASPVPSPDLEPYFEDTPSDAHIVELVGAMDVRSETVARFQTTWKSKYVRWMRVTSTDLAGGELDRCVRSLAQPSQCQRSVLVLELDETDLLSIDPSGQYHMLGGPHLADTIERAAQLGIQVVISSPESLIDFEHTRGERSCILRPTRHDISSDAKPSIAPQVEALALLLRFMGRTGCTDFLEIAALVSPAAPDSNKIAITELLESGLVDYADWLGTCIAAVPTTHTHTPESVLLVINHLQSILDEADGPTAWAPSVWRGLGQLALLASGMGGSLAEKSREFLVGQLKFGRRLRLEGESPGLALELASRHAGSWLESEPSLNDLRIIAELSTARALTFDLRGAVELAGLVLDEIAKLDAASYDDLEADVARLGDFARRVEKSCSRELLTKPPHRHNFWRDALDVAYGKGLFVPDVRFRVEHGDYSAEFRENSFPVDDLRYLQPLDGSPSIDPASFFEPTSGDFADLGRIKWELLPFPLPEDAGRTFDAEWREKLPRLRRICRLAGLPLRHAWVLAAELRMADVDVAIAPPDTSPHWGAVMSGHKATLSSRRTWIEGLLDQLEEPG